MADHTDLIAELPLVEKMTTQERLKHAKKRRLHQLKMWTQREKELTSKRHKTNQNLSRKSKKSDYKIHFVPSVMLLEAAARNDVDEVRRLLLLGVSPDSTNEDGLTALHQCCIDDSEEMMKLLLEFGANVNAEDSEKWTPLHAAATCGHLNLVKYLISKGANLLAVNADGNMPYDICEDEKTLDYIEAEMAKRGITQQLIDDTRAATEMQMLKDLRWIAENDGDLDYQDEQGATYLHIAAANGYSSVIEFLLDSNANPSIPDNDRWHPIHAAACWGHPDILEMLVQHGVDLNARTKNGETPYDICEDPELKERIQQLKSEMEIKRTQQTNRLRRTHSQNTRSQSVRRTSIREKSQISWKEAREEAKLRLVQQDKIQSNKQIENEKNLIDNKDEKTVPIINVDDITLTFSSGNKEKSNLDNNKSKEVSIADIIGKQTDGWQKDSENLKETTVEQRLAKQDPKEKRNRKDNFLKQETKENGKADSNSLSDSECEVIDIIRTSNGSATENSPHLDSSAKSIAAATAVASSRTQADVKVDLSIHVTVNASPNSYNPTYGTLADLKKQRADLRSRGSNISTSSREQSPIEDHKMNGHSKIEAISKYAYEHPPSPTTERHRFYGTATEVIGPPQKHGCCHVM